MYPDVSLCCCQIVVCAGFLAYARHLTSLIPSAYLPCSAFLWPWLLFLDLDSSLPAPLDYPPHLIFSEQTFAPDYISASACSLGPSVFSDYSCSNFPHVFDFVSVCSYRLIAFLPHSRVLLGSTVGFYHVWPMLWNWYQVKLYSLSLCLYIMHLGLLISCQWQYKVDWTIINPTVLYCKQVHKEKLDKIKARV